MYQNQKIKLTDLQKQTIKNLLAKFESIKKTSYAGVSNYTNAKGEIANHNVIINARYENSVKKDIEKLKNATLYDLKKIALDGDFKLDMVVFAVNKLLTAFEKNMDKETRSNQSKAQDLAYYHITKSIKLHLETLQLFIHAKEIKKTVLKKGTYKHVNSRELTLCQNAIRKYFKFDTIKYRYFKIDPKQLNSVRLAKDIFNL